MNIREALQSADTMSDDQWTSTGEIRLEFVEKLVGAKVSRQAVVDAAPGFTRSDTILPDMLLPTEEKTFDFMDSPEDFVKELKKVPEQDLPAMVQFLDDLILENEDTIRVAQEMAATLKYQKLLVQKRMNVLNPPLDNMQTIRSYLDGQIAARTAKHGVKIEVLKLLGPVKFDQIDPRSVLDRAMSKKTSRGTKRPARI